MSLHCDSKQKNLFCCLFLNILNLSRGTWINNSLILNILIGWAVEYCGDIMFYYLLLADTSGCNNNTKYSDFMIIIFKSSDLFHRYNGNEGVLYTPKNSQTRTHHQIQLRVILLNTFWRGLSYSSACNTISHPLWPTGREVDIIWTQLVLIDSQISFIFLRMSTFSTGFSIP